MNKKILAVFAHPDDEAFGPGGTLAKYAREGAEIHLLSATRGERGQWDEESKIKNQESRIHNVREKELLESAEILGIKSVEFLDFKDGELCNSIYHDLAKKIIAKIESFKPQVVLTLDRLGVSGHLDHIAVSMITTYAFRKTSEAIKLYYYCLPRKWYQKSLSNYFVYFPEGYKEEEITTKINYNDYWAIKKKAMLTHKSQMKDVTRLLVRFNIWPKTDNFILQFSRNVEPRFPERDLFEGLS